MPAPSAQPLTALTTYHAMSDYLRTLDPGASIVLEYDAGMVLTTVAEALADYDAGERFTVPGANDL